MERQLARVCGDTIGGALRHDAQRAACVRPGSSALAAWALGVRTVHSI